MESEKVKEIKKALECCSTLMNIHKTSEEQDKACQECPYRINDRCSWKLDSDALTLINELECENERLNTPDPFWFCSYGGCEGACKECIDTCEMSILVKERLKTIKEFATELRSIYQHLDGDIDIPVRFIREDIDCVVKVLSKFNEVEQ